MIAPSDLTQRQQEVAHLVARGRTNQQIAGLLGITDRMVRIHVTALAYLIGADASGDVRVQIALWWFERQTDLPLSEIEAAA